LIENKISTKLGDLKIIDKNCEGIFLAPKSYILYNKEQNNFKLKLKSIKKKKLNLSDKEIFQFFKSKLNKNNEDLSLNFLNPNLFKKFINTFTIQNVSLNTSVKFGFNKREKIYDNNDN
jgi:hypothetical protein